MANVQKLKDYINKQREKGFSDSEIKKKLLDANYSSKLISEAFVGKEAEEAPKPKKKILLISVLVILAAVLVVALVMKISPQKAANETLNPYDARFLYLCYAVKYNDVSYCYKFEEPPGFIIREDLSIVDLRDQCNDQFYIVAAGKNRNPALCNKIKSEETSKMCAENVLASLKLFEQEKSPIEICEAVVGASTGATPDDYNLCLAFLLGDVSYCYKIEETSKDRTNCLIFAPENPDCSFLEK